SGGDSPSGTIQFSITAPDNTTTNVGGLVTVSGDGTYNAPTTVADRQSRRYNWNDVSSGYALNNGALDTGTHDSVTPLNASPSLSSSASDTRPAVVTTFPYTTLFRSSGGDSPSGTIQFSITAPDNTTTNVGGLVTVSGDGTYNAPTTV